MHRLPTIPFDQPMPESDELEGELSSDPSTLPDRMKLGIAWVCATVTGIVALVYATMSQFPQTYALGGLVGLLAAYAAYGSSLRKKNTVQFADSLYYMGFLWSVFALLATFVVWPAPKLTADAVLTTFGYALVATFSGMLLRLVVIQFQGGLPDRLVYAQETVDRRVAALHQQIDEATREITSFRNRAGGDLVAMHHDLMQALVDVRERISEEYRAMTTMMGAGIESSLKDMLGRLAAVEIPQDLLTTEVAKLIAALGKRGEEVEAAVQLLEKSVMQAADNLTRLGTSLCESEAAMRMETALNELSHAIQERRQEFGNLSAALENGRTELESQFVDMQSLRTACRNVSTQLSTLEAELRDVSSQSLSAEVRNGLLNVHKTIQSSLDASKAIDTAMRGIMSFLKASAAEEHATDGK